jgi:Rhodopirellula transposase DDE domain
MLGRWRRGVDVDAVLAGLFELIAPHLTEKQRRLLAGAGARALGPGGGARMARISGLSRPTVYAGVRELEERPDPGGRIRRRGGGPKRRTMSDPSLLAALDALVEPYTRDDPDSPLRWTCKSIAQLAVALTAAGHPFSDDTVGRLLKQQGYTLQRTQKTLEGAQHPDRDGQFRYVNEQARSHLADGQPVVSVDTKKKELVGRYANGGAEWQPAGAPERVGVHDFPGPKVGKAIPTGSMTWAPTPAGSAWEPTMTRRRLRWRPCGAGGSRPAGSPTPRLTGCWSPRTRVGPTATGPGPGRPSWPGSRSRRG